MTLLDLDDAALEHWSASRYAWRWNDAKYDVLPSDTLARISSISQTCSRSIFPDAQDLEKWVRAKPDRVLDVSDMRDDEVARWLYSCVLAVPARLIVSWGREDAVLLPWVSFAAHWSSFCHPSSDDVIVFPPSEAWALAYSHDEVFSWRSKT